MDLYEAFNRGRTAGEERKRQSAISQYFQGATRGDPNALAQVYQADPSAGMQAQKFQQDEQAREAENLLNAAQFYTRSKDPKAWAYLHQKLTTHPQFAGVTQGMPSQLSTPEDIDGSVRFAQSLVSAFTGGQAEVDKWEQTAIPDPNDPNQELVVLRSGDRYKNIDGSPLTFTGGGTIPSAAPSSSFDALRAAVEKQESSGNPNAISPKGAVGRMQTMPATLADPGFGVRPAADNSDAEMTRVGNEYLQAMLNKYGDTRLALAAYNWGPGSVDAALKRHRGNVGAVLAGAPEETRKYVSNITRSLGGGQVPPAGNRFSRPRFKPGESSQNAPSGYRFTAAGTLEPIKGGPADRKNNPTPADMAQGEMAMRKEVSALLQPHRTVVQQFEKLKTAASSPSAANDLSMIFSYMKMLDPGSVVREQEFANAQNAAGVPDRVRNMYNKMLNGERLNPNQRREFLQAASGLADTSQRAIDETGQQYAEIATQYGWDPDRATGVPRRRAPAGSGQGTATPVRSSRSAPVRVTSAADYNALPSGTEFIAPDGSHRRKR